MAFVDTDVEVDEADLLALLAHFDDPQVALVAPRVVGPIDGRDRSTRYEAGARHSTAARSRRGSPPAHAVSFVPAAVIVCRTDGGPRRSAASTTTLRYGEDVDLVWRLVRAADGAAATSRPWSPATARATRCGRG